MEEKISGLVLSGINYGESDKIINIFTPKGVVSAKLKSVKKAGAKLKFASEPFCFVEFVFSIGKVGRTVIGASLIDSFYPLRLDLKKLYVSSAILSFAKKFCHENIDSSEIFLLSLDTLKKTAYGGESVVSYLLDFMCKALLYSGYGLNFNGCERCGKEPSNKVFFDYRSGSFYCEECYSGGGREILIDTYLTIKKVINNETISDEQAIKGLMLIDYYLENRPEVNIEPLKEIIKIYVEAKKEAHNG